MGFKTGFCIYFQKHMLRDCLKFIGASGFNKVSSVHTDQFLVCTKTSEHLKLDRTKHHCTPYIAAHCMLEC